MQKSHILIVEDEDVTRFNLRHLFEAEGYLVSEATDLGADAIVGIRFSTSAIMDGSSEIMAFGTAVKLRT